MLLELSRNFHYDISNEKSDRQINTSFSILLSNVLNNFLKNIRLKSVFTDEFYCKYETNSIGDIA